MDHTLPGVTPTKGKRAIREYLERLMEAWSDLKIEVLGLEEQGEMVLATYRLTGQGRASGVTISAKAATVVRVRDGVAVSWCAYRDRNEAETAYKRP